MSFRIMIIDNFAIPDSDAASEGPSFARYEDAVLHCRAIVNSFLEHNWEEGMSATDLWERYTLFGEDPVVSDDQRGRFSGWEYARGRCKELCRV